MPKDAPPAAGHNSLSAFDQELILAHAAASDRGGMFTEPLQALIHERGWLRMLAPRALGGAELPLPAAVRLEESLAAVDGSVGWTVTLCAGAGWFAGFLPPSFARRILGTPKLCVGGSGAPSGVADTDGDGYRLSGRWDFATGAPMTTHFTLNAIVREAGQPVIEANGEPRIRSFIVPAALVRIEPTWRTIGLRATASHTFSIDGAWVGREHLFQIDAANATCDGPLYRFPFDSLAFVTLAANVAGMATNFLELAQAVIGRRKHSISGLPLATIPQVAQAVNTARASLDEVRARFYTLLDDMWDKACRGEVVAVEETGTLHNASLQLVITARRAVDELYPFCGLHAADQDSSIGRVWRDLHTATQHAMLAPVYL